MSFEKVVNKVLKLDDYEEANINEYHRHMKFDTKLTSFLRVIFF